jgi:hypothetical protein
LDASAVHDDRPSLAALREQLQLIADGKLAASDVTGAAMLSPRTKMIVQRGKCARCAGDGWYYDYDGVGGRWRERCRVCSGSGSVEILVAEQAVESAVETPTPVTTGAPVVPAAPPTIAQVTSDDASVRFSLLELE